MECLNLVRKTVYMKYVFILLLSTYLLSSCTKEFSIEDRPQDSPKPKPCSTFTITEKNKYVCSDTVMYSLLVGGKKGEGWNLHELSSYFFLGDDSLTWAHRTEKSQYAFHPNGDSVAYCRFRIVEKGLFHKIISGGDNVFYYWKFGTKRDSSYTISIHPTYWAMHDQDEYVTILPNEIP